MSTREGLLQRIGVQPAERGLIGFAALSLLLLGASAFALLNAAETLFLKRVGVEALPLALLASSGLLVVTTGLAGRVASANPPGWLPRILVALALSLLPFIALASSQAPMVLGALLLVSRQVLALGMLSFWLAMGSLVPARRAKVIFAPLASGVTVGGILGSFGSEPLARWLGIEGLIASCAVGLLLSGLAGLRLRGAGARQLDRSLGQTASRGAPSDASLFGLLRSNRLFRLLAVALLCGGAMSPVLYFEFASVLDAATQGPEGEQRMLDLYAQFRGWMNVAMLVSQLWLSSLLYRRIGLPLSMALWPAAYVIGLTWLGLDFALLAAMLSWGLAQVSEDGISDSAARVLYNLFPDGVRNQATGLLEGPINRLGGLLGNGFIMGALAIGASAWVGWAALPVACLWLLSALVLWRIYPDLLLRASAEHGLVGAGIDRARLLDAATLRSLASYLADPDPRLSRAAVDLLVDGEPRLVTRLLAEGVEVAPETTRPLVVGALQRLVEPLPPDRVRSGEAIASLARSLRARPPLPPEERGDLWQVYARLTSGEDAPAPVPAESRALLERGLGDRAATVRLATVAELHRRGAPPPGLPDLGRVLADALDASDALLRRAARKELRSMLLTTAVDETWHRRLEVLAGHLEKRADRAETAEALLAVARRHGANARGVAEAALRYANDRDPRVRGAVWALAGHAGLVDEAAHMVAALGARSPEDVDGASEGLIALGAAAALPLLAAFETGGPAQRSGILAIVGELEIDPETLEELRVRQLDAIHLAVVHHAALEGAEGPAARLLRRRLEERVLEGVGSLLLLLGAMRDQPRLAELERRLRRAPDGRERDLLVEAIESLLGREDRELIVPLLEVDDSAVRVGAAARALGRLVPDAATAAEELRASSDTSSRQLASVWLDAGQGAPDPARAPDSETVSETTPVEGGEAIGDPAWMPSAIEIAARLQESPGFDRLSTPQLLGLAGLLQEQKVAAGDRVYRAGDEGPGLYFVLEGEVELRRGSQLIEQVGPGGFFGELSALDGIPRSVDALAVQPTSLLRLERDDLLPLLEDAPVLAIGLAQALSSRVRRLIDRLEAYEEPTAEEAS